MMILMSRSSAESGSSTINGTHIFVKNYVTELSIQMIRLSFTIKKRQDHLDILDSRFPKETVETSCYPVNPVKYSIKK